MKDIIDRNYQEKLYKSNRKEWDMRAQDSQNAAKDFNRYIKQKERCFTKSYEIMELFKQYQLDPDFRIVLKKFLEKYQFDQ